MPQRTSLGPTHEVSPVHSDESRQPSPKASTAASHMTSASGSPGVPESQPMSVAQARKRQQRKE
jgi:hypothetical protein